MHEIAVILVLRLHIGLAQSKRPVVHPFGFPFAVRSEPFLGILSEIARNARGYLHFASPSIIWLGWLVLLCRATDGS